MPWNFNPANFKSADEEPPPSSATPDAIVAAGTTTISTGSAASIFGGGGLGGTGLGGTYKAPDTRGPYFNPVGYDQNLRAGGWSPREGSAWVGPTFAVSQEAKESAMMERQMELKARRAVEEEKRKQQTAALVVRKIIQKVRQSTAETIDDLKAELEQCQIDQFDRMGPIEAEKIREEAEKAIHQATLRLEEEIMKRSEELRLKAEEEARRSEEMARLTVLQTSCLEEVASTEALVSAARSKAKEITEDPNAMDNPEISELCQRADDDITAALAAVTEAQKNVNTKRQDMGTSDVATEIKNSVEMKGIPAKLNAWRSALNTIKNTVKSYSERAQRQLAQQKRQEEMKKQFTLYKSDESDHITKEGVISLASDVFELEIDQDMVDRIWLKLSVGTQGIPFSKFPQLKNVLTTEKQLQKDREKKLEEERQKLEAEEKKEALNVHLKPAREALCEAEAAAGRLKRVLNKLTPMQAKKLSSQELVATCDEVDAEVASIYGAIERAEAIAKDLDGGDEGETQEFLSFRRTQLASIRGRIKTTQTSVKRGQETGAEARAKVERAIVSDMEKMRQQVAGVVCEISQKEGKEAEQLFDAAGGADGSMDFTKFLTFVKSFSDRCPPKSLPEALSPDVLDEQLMERLFKHVAGCGGDVADSPLLRRTGFTELLARASYRVARATVLTAELDISSGAIGRLEAGEVIHAVGPLNSEGAGAAGMTRVRCRTASNLEGWVTVTGSKGAAFLEPLGLFYYCIKEVVMTTELSVEESKTVRYLEKGELVQVLEPATKDASIGLLRVRCKAKRDGKEGWVSIAGNKGTFFLDPC